MRGFTIIELLVTVAVIMILSAILVGAGSQSKNQQALNQTASFLAQTLSQYQEKAMGAQQGDCHDAGLKACGFGLNFKKNNAFFQPFIDCASDCASSSHTLTGQDAVSGNTSLNARVKLCDVDPSNNLDIVFVPPDPQIYIQNLSWNKEAQVVICLQSDGSRQKKVKINSAGRIEIE
ncbi:MAG: type II secretion system GspH family protein [Patescibacteria group bacterium]|nr:type II secretion system GspH family protein [Patescibacteria group bacterium]